MLNLHKGWVNWIHCSCEYFYYDVFYDLEAQKELPAVSANFRFRQKELQSNFDALKNTLNE